MERLLIIIPAYNEQETIGEVLKKLPRQINHNVIVHSVVIDDGSQDKTRFIAEKKTRVISHALNRGLGAALATGFAYARLKKYDYVVTFDADGQHDPKDIPRLLNPLIESKADIVIGSRLGTRGQMPLLRRLINWSSNIFTWLLFTIWTTDSQSGFRAFNHKAIEELKIKSQRMEVSSEIFKEIKRLQLTLKEVPVTSIYTNYSLKKGQSITNAPNVVWKLVINYFS